MKLLLGIVLCALLAFFLQKGKKESKRNKALRKKIRDRVMQGYVSDSVDAEDTQEAEKHPGKDAEIDRDN